MIESYVPVILGMLEASIWQASAAGFLWGLCSVLLSPCHLASIPLMAGFTARDAQDSEGDSVGVRAAQCAVVFSAGLFLSIAAVGGLCSMLGQMLGTVPAWLALLVGLLFVWLGLQTAGVVKATIPAVLPRRFALKGPTGAFVLGAGYGLLSGPCTFGFLAPILAVAALPGSLGTGLVLLLCFACGHCLPIAAAGCSSALCSAWLENRWAGAAVKVARPIAGILIASAGVFVIWSVL